MRPCFLFEPLEPRITFSAGFIAADGIPGGAVKLDLGREQYWDAVVFQPDGKILASGSAYSRTGYECSDNLGPQEDHSRTSFVRFNPDGSRDSDFGDEGIVNLYCFGESFYQLLLQPDGKILGMSDQNGIFRFTADGRIDKTFQNTVFDLPIPNFDYYDFERIAVAPDGRIISGGQAWTEDEQGSYLGLLSFNSDGTRDLSFGAGGALSAEYALPFSWGDLFAIQSDGKILVATGDHDDDYDRKPGTLLRFNPDGTPDESFADHGQFHLSAG